MQLLIITLWLKFQIGSKKQYFASRDYYAKYFGTWIKMIFATVIGTICHIDFARVLIYCVGVIDHCLNITVALHYYMLFWFMMITKQVWKDVMYVSKMCITILRYPHFVQYGTTLEI